MNSQANNHRKSEAARSGIVQRFAGLVVLIETIVAAMIVVGVFAAASQPFGWSSLVQFLLCAGLAVLLWLADSRLETGEMCAVPVTRTRAGRRHSQQEA